MAGFKPKNTGNAGGNSDRDFEPRNLPTPKAGNRKARVSLIIDLGTQNRDDFEDEQTGEKKPQKPCQQVAIFVDLVNDVVDYGGKIGKQQYRLPVNKTFQGVIQGINFTTSAPKDAKGNTLQGKPWGIHPRNAITALAKATNNEEILTEGKHPEALDISLLLNEPLMVNVEVKKTPHKEGKKDKDGNPIVYTNVNFKGAAPVPLDDDDNPMAVADLSQPARCITFDDAKEEDIQFIRPSIIKIIKKANDYEGSAMQAAIEAYEASGAGNDDGGTEDEQEEAPKAEVKKPVTTKAKPAAQPKTKPASAPVEDPDQDEPF